MENTITISLSNQMALRRTMDTIANNMANMNTTAYKAESILFKEHLTDVPDSTGRPFFMVLDYGLARDFREGDMTRTEAPLDLAISGRGFFSVETPEGERYTRNGHFRVNNEAQLVTADGYPVLGTDGQPITIPLENGSMTITREGSVTNHEGVELARIAVVDFPESTKLEKEGLSLYKSDTQAQPAEDFYVLQGMIEESNVSPIIEMTRMIEVAKSYQSAAEVIERTSDMTRRSVERLGRVDA